jgi:dolichol-phosphate mannosyltransferase
MQMKKTLKLSIIIPVYNEEQTVAELFKKVDAVKLPDIEKEIIIVDDGSTDNSKKLIKQLKTIHTNVKIYLSEINLGKGAAIRFGLKKATGDIILIQDADLELEPKEYKNLIAPILEGKTKVVYGSRFLKKNPKISRKTLYANKFLTVFTNILYGSRITDMETAYKVFTADVIKNIRLRCVEFDFEPEVTAKILQLGHKIYEVPISYEPRRVDEGKKITYYDGIEAISQLVKNRLFPRPTNTKK